jgi:hypothetical protein
MLDKWIRVRSDRHLMSDPDTHSDPDLDRLRIRIHFNQMYPKAKLYFFLKISMMNENDENYDTHDTERKKKQCTLAML